MSYPAKAKPRAPPKARASPISNTSRGIDRAKGKQGNDEGLPIKRPCGELTQGENDRGREEAEKFLSNLRCDFYWLTPDSEGPYQGSPKRFNAIARVAEFKNETTGEWEQPATRPPQENKQTQEKGTEPIHRIQCSQNFAFPWGNRNIMAIITWYPEGNRDTYIFVTEGPELPHEEREYIRAFMNNLEEGITMVDVLERARETHASKRNSSSTLDNRDQQ